MRAPFQHLAFPVLLILLAGLATIPAKGEAQEGDLEEVLPSEIPGYVLGDVSSQGDQAVQGLYRPEADGEAPVNLIVAAGADGDELYQQIQGMLQAQEAELDEIQVGEREFVAFQEGSDYVAVANFEGFTLAAGYDGIDPDGDRSALAASVEGFLQSYDPERVMEAEVPEEVDEADVVMADPPADELCEDMSCFAERVQACEPATVRPSLAPGLTAAYSVEGPAAGGGCALTFQFAENPNPDLVEVPLHFVLDEGQPWEEATVEEIMEGCLGGDEEALDRYRCEGPLLEEEGIGGPS